MTGRSAMVTGDRPDKMDQFFPDFSNNLFRV